jgi:hypothetical protein
MRVALVHRDLHAVTRGRIGTLYGGVIASDTSTMEVMGM